MLKNKEKIPTLIKQGESNTFQFKEESVHPTLVNYDEKTLPQASLADIDLKKVDEYLLLR